MTTPRTTPKKPAHYKLETLSGMSREARIRAIFWVAITEGYYGSAKALIEEEKENPFDQTTDEIWGGRNDHLAKIPSDLTSEEIQKLIEDYPDQLERFIYEEKKPSPLLSKMTAQACSSQKFRYHLSTQVFGFVTSDPLYLDSLHKYSNDPDRQNYGFRTEIERIFFAGVKHAISNDNIDKVFQIIQLLKKNIRRILLNFSTYSETILCKEEGIGAAIFLNESITYALKEKRFDVAHRIFHECSSKLQKFCFLYDLKMNTVKYLHLMLGYNLKDFTEDNLKEYANEVSFFPDYYERNLEKNLEPLLTYNKHLENTQDVDLKTFERWRLKEISSRQFTPEMVETIVKKLTAIHPRLLAYFQYTLLRLTEEKKFTITLAEFLPGNCLAEIVLDYTGLDSSACELNLESKGNADTKAGNTDKKCERDSSKFISDLRENLAGLHFSTSVVGKVFAKTDDTKSRKANKLIKSLPVDLTQKENQIFVLKVALVLSKFKPFVCERLIPVELEALLSLGKEEALLHDLSTKLKGQLRARGLNELEIQEMNLMSVCNELKNSNTANLGKKN